MRALYWIRNDFRINDNTALYQATSQSNDGVVAVFFIPQEMRRVRSYNDLKVDFILNSIEAFARDLLQLNIPLLIRDKQDKKEVELEIIKIIDQYNCSSLFYNFSYESRGDNFENRIIKLFNKLHLPVYSFNDETILQLGMVRKDNNKFYSKFKPFKDRWIRTYKDLGVKVLSRKPLKQKPLMVLENKIYESKKSYSSIKAVWPAGEFEAQKRLKQFINCKIKHYNTTRDYPAKDGTSKLSPYLAVGTISPKRCLQEAIDANDEVFGVPEHMATREDSAYPRIDSRRELGISKDI